MADAGDSGAKTHGVGAVPAVEWTERGAVRRARWRSEAALAPPRRVVLADDRTTADAAYRLACEGTALLWRGDFQNARQLLLALGRRAEARPRKAHGAQGTGAVASAQAFHLHRMARAQRARILGMLLIGFEPGHVIALKRAPDVTKACAEARGDAVEAYVASLSELLGIIGAHQWRLKGVEVPALDARIHPHYGVFAPVRGEYVDLVARAPLPATAIAFEIGTGTGVLAALLARRGLARIVATDNDPRALACARENLLRLGLAARVELVEADLYPAGRAGLLVCNPPWLPGRAGSPLERAIYDADARMLAGFLEGVKAHLEPAGEAWLIMSDLAVHLGLRARGELEDRFAAVGLAVVGRLDARPRHAKAADATDPFFAARHAEVTTLWRLGAA